MSVAEGQTAILTCRVFGAPKPSIIWQKGVDQIDVYDLAGGRHSVLDNGDMQIRVSVCFTTGQG